MIVYLIDTLRPDVLGAYGGPVATPSLDRLASGGELFERAYSTSSWTRPAVASLISGLPVSAHQVRNEGFSLPESALTLAEQFRRRGYQTIGAIANGHVLPDFHFDQGFEIYDWPPLGETAGSIWAPNAKAENPPAAAVNELALRRLAEVRDPARPLFLYVHTVDPHEPYRPPDWLLPGRRPATLANHILMRSINESERASPAILRDLALEYEGAVAYADRELGRFLDAMASRVDLENSIILVVSDHGEGFFEHRFVGHRNWLYEELTRVPMILRGPGVPAGRRVVLPVSLLDVAPTLLALADPDSSSRPSTPGIDIAAEEGSSRLAGRAVLSEFGSGATLVQGEWKLSYRADYPKAFRYQLHDLRLDPAEEDDVLDREPSVARRLEVQLADWQSAARRWMLDPLPVNRERLEPGLVQNLRALGYLQ